VQKFYVVLFYRRFKGYELESRVHINMGEFQRVWVRWEKDGTSKNGVRVK